MRNMHDFIGDLREHNMNTEQPLSQGGFKLCRRTPGVAWRMALRTLFVALAVAAGAALAAPPLASATAFATDSPQPLPALNIDIGQTSVSGISSGGFMAVQFQVAHSAIVKGAGVVAGGPYDCAQGDLVTATTRCSCTGEPYLNCRVGDDSTDVPALLRTTARLFAAGLIDDPANLAGQKTLILAGLEDPLVPRTISAQLADFYRGAGVPAANVSTVTLDHAGHTFPTKGFGNACAVTGDPYLGKCGFDSAKAILEWIYGPLKASKSGKAKGRFQKFDQRPYIPQDPAPGFAWSSGLDSSGWVYVPDNCAKGEPCRLHVALHGCKQGHSYLPLKPPAGGGLYYGTTFLANAGYDRLADANHLVILFPQAVSVPLRNPNGCWDWWGYTNRHYADRQGVQIRALRAMVDRLSSGARH